MNSPTIPRLTMAGMVMLGIAGAIFAASMIHRVNLLLLLFSLIVSAFFIGVILGRRQLKGIDATRSAPTLVAAGQPWIGFLDASSSRRRGRAFGLHAQIGFQEPTRASTWIPLPPIPPRSRIQAKFSLTLPRRGVHTFRPLRLATSYPFGFFRWQREVVIAGPNEPIVVYPTLGQLSLEACRRLGLAAIGDGRGTIGILEGVDEFRGVRDFRTGDPSRLIHWRSTARRGSLVVRELDPAASRNILMLVDLRASKKNSTSDELAERVLSFAATAVVQACRDPSLQLTLLIAGEKPLVVRGLASSARLGTYLRALAVAEATCDRGAFGRASRALRSTDTRDRRLWIVSVEPMPMEDLASLSRGGARGLSERVLIAAASQEFDQLFQPAKASYFSPVNESAPHDA